MNRPVCFVRFSLPWRLCAALALLAVHSGVTAREPPPEGKPPPKPAANKSDEPLAEALSLAKSAEFLGE
jgi:hypothetical protein